MTSDAPLLLHGGTVFTAVRGALWAEALVLDGARVAAVGAYADLVARWPGARTLDVGGRTVLPGLVDAHNHFMATGESLGSVDLRYPGVSSIDDAVRLLREAAAGTPSGQWVSGFGFDDAKYERPLTRWDLDEASTSHPIRVHHVSGHHVFVSSSGLAASGVAEDTPDPQGGRLVRAADGRLTGQCLDSAMNLILSVAVDIGSHGPNFHTTTSLEAPSTPWSGPGSPTLRPASPPSATPR